VFLAVISFKMSKTQDKKKKKRAAQSSISEKGNTAKT
jgi:hypothetical protein